MGETTCQILADILQRDVVVVESPQNIGAVGAAACIAVGMGAIPSIFDVKKLIPVKTTYKPNPANKAVYDRNFKVFKNLYKANKENFAILQRLSPYIKESTPAPGVQGLFFITKQKRRGRTAALCFFIWLYSPLGA